MKNVKCVDINGKIIKSLKNWKLRNPGKLYFDSKFEWRVYKYLESQKLEFDFHPEKTILQPGFQCLALNAKGKLFKSTVRPITYTPDFKIICGDKIIYLETKGFFTEASRLRVKLFQHQLKPNELFFIAHDKYRGKGQDAIKDVKSIIEIINRDILNKENKSIKKCDI